MPKHTAKRHPDPSGRPRNVRVTALDPQTRCGLGTTVEQLYRVEERVADGRVVHLIFNDRHGWYCLHGPACPAINDVRRHLGLAKRPAAVQVPTRRARGA
jgi:hypothetical protein